MMRFVIYDATMSLLKYAAIVCALGAVLTGELVAIDYLLAPLESYAEASQ